MERMIWSLRLLAVFIFAANIAGCASMGLKPHEIKGSNEYELTFVDSSKGLPSDGQWREGIAFFDINGDGAIDILAPAPRHAKGEMQKPHLWYGSQNGEWRETPLHVPGLGYGYGDIAVADFDRDGVPDIGLATHGGGLTALRGKGGEKYVYFSAGMPSQRKFSSRTLVAADLNNDGAPDIAAVSEGKFGDKFPDPSGIRVCYCVNGRWECHSVGEEEKVFYLYADHIAVGDVNGDGNKDIAVASLVSFNNLIVWVGDGKGGFEPFNKGLPVNIHYPSVAFADIDKDGRDDLIANISGFGPVRDQSGIKAFLSRPGGFEDISEGLPGKPIYSALAAADLDGDDSVEIVLSTALGGLQVFSRSGDKWSQLKVSGLPEKGLMGTCNVYCLDLNGDGRKDIAVNYASEQFKQGGIRVFLNRTTSSRM